MSDIYKQIKKDIITSLKQKNGETLTLRSVDAIIQLVSKETKKEITDELVIDVLTKAIKQRQDSIDAFEKGKRPDLVEKEKYEQDVLKRYLPEQLTEKEILEIIKDAVTFVEANSIKDMGRVMGVVMPKTKGKAEGKLVSNLVKKTLGG